MNAGSRAAGTLGRIGHKSQTVISGLILEMQKELKKPDPDDRIVEALLSALRVLTGQAFAYQPEDPLSVKRSNLMGWLRWWEANATSFPAGIAGGPADENGFVRVNSTPAGASIFLDGAATGYTTPFLLLNVTAGKHKLQLTKERYADWSSSVTVTRGRTSEAHAVLHESFGNLLFTSAPSGVAAKLDSAEIGNTPRLLVRLSTGSHSLALTRQGYPGWDSTVVVKPGQTTNVMAVLKTRPDSQLISYANAHGSGWLSWKGPERAVRFSARSGFGYPLHITRVSAEFYLYTGNPFMKPWPDSSFRFKSYGRDGHTLLYESPVLEAIPGQPGPAVVHELSTSILIDSGEFYVSVAPIDSSGMPSSLSWSRFSDWQAPHGVPDDTSGRRSYVGSSGHWSPLDRGELSISVLVRR